MKAGIYRRGPWLAIPTLRGQTYEITCSALPGWAQEVPSNRVQEALRMLADQFPELSLAHAEA